MTDSLMDWVSQIDLFSKISDYIISIDILNDGRYLTASTITEDGSIDIQLPLEDIVYLIEYGTATFPGKFILEHIVNWSAQKLNDTIDTIYNGVFNLNWNLSNIDYSFQILENQINDYIRGYLGSYYETVQFLHPVQEADRDISFLMDISILQKYIRCKISKK